MSKRFLARFGVASTVVAIIAGFQTSAVASPVIAPPSFGHSMATTRIEPPRPGGIPGEPRETTPFWRSDNADQAVVAKPTFKSKRRRH